MKSHLFFPILLAAILWQAGCAFPPQRNLRLEEARSAYREAHDDPQLALLAAEELKEAGEMLERAIAAWNTLDDPAVVDHLAYLAKQRVAIAREAARRKASSR